ncbi:MAG TPA: RdgB/HAM1 family non-canonical purine NTP pyrophosphatase [Nocardioidaceae bacterium]|nr:RdgB/HAM1 family non-canonical purine NTP pyrophosphatase [Nocardioidaceae bacterium]
MSQVVLATHNPGKLAELRRILEPLVTGVDVLGLDDVADYPEPAETELTFEGNALIKARAAVSATGLPALADDSGLCVEALNLMPGVLSARWAGPDKNDADNNALLLRQLTGLPSSRRGAEFRCSVAFYAPGAKPIVRRGVMAGRVIRELRGAGGFGYDALFVPEGHRQTTAEMGSELKDELSHRGKALRAIAPQVAAALQR